MRAALWVLDPYPHGLRLAVPVHTILRFEEEQEAFDEATSAAEKAAR